MSFCLFWRVAVCERKNQRTALGRANMEAAIPPERIDEFLYKEIRSEMNVTEM
jgi:hypothetical protein